MRTGPCLALRTNEHHARKSMQSLETFPIGYVERLGGKETGPPARRGMEHIFLWRRRGQLRDSRPGCGRNLMTITGRGRNRTLTPDLGMGYPPSSRQKTGDENPHVAGFHAGRGLFFGAGKALWHLAELMTQARRYSMYFLPSSVACGHKGIACPTHFRPTLWKT